MIPRLLISFVAILVFCCSDEEQEGDLASMADRASIDSVRLSKFLARAGQVRGSQSTWTGVLCIT